MSQNSDSLYKTNIAYQLMYHFFEEEKISISIIIILVIILNILQTNVISTITSSIIDAVEHNKFSEAMTQYKYFIGVSVIYFAMYSINEVFQIKILTKLTPWMRVEFFKHILRINNENLTQQNVIRFNTPINRISYAAASLLNSVITIALSNTSFILIITGYFLYKNIVLGIAFLALNIFLLMYVVFTWDHSMNYKKVYEDHLNKNEQEVIDLFNNFDKIIYRGQINSEIEQYENRANTCISSAMDFYNQNTKGQLIMLSMIYFIIIVSVGYLIYSKINNSIDTKTFITFITILLLYRDKLTGLLQMIPQFMDFTSRIQYALNKIKEIQPIQSSSSNTQIPQKYIDSNIEFNEIRFESVSYKYDSNDSYLFQNLNLNIDTTQQIVGITGNSGKGKSTMMKLLLKLYKNYEGNIYIDNTNIREIDPEYIRKNITYVNQSSKLFDKPVMDNMFYGCINKPDCSKYLEIIMKYPLIRELFKTVDVEKQGAGSLGENLSGGQRQVVNILSGLINPSPILILDEPTNALDLSLKQELLGIIESFKQHKKCIIIITHDRDAYPLFDTRIRI